MACGEEAVTTSQYFAFVMQTQSPTGPCQLCRQMKRLLHKVSQTAGVRGGRVKSVDAPVGAMLS